MRPGLETGLRTVLFNPKEYAIFDLREQANVDVCNLWHVVVVHTLTADL